MVDVMNNCVPENSSGNLGSLLNAVSFQEVETMLDGISQFQSFRKQYLDNAPASSVSVNLIN